MRRVSASPYLGRPPPPRCPPAPAGAPSWALRGSGTVSTAGLGPLRLEGISGTQAHDASGKGDHGALTNVTGSNARKFGRALSFNGASEFS